MGQQQRGPDPSRALIGDERAQNAKDYGAAACRHARSRSEVTQIRPRLLAAYTASARLLTSSLRMMLLTWNLAVVAEM